MADLPRLSVQTAHVLSTFLDEPRIWRYGYDISRATGIKSGTLYPILMRLAECGLLETDWEHPEGGGPPRHIYHLIAGSLGSARAYVRACDELEAGRRPSHRRLRPAHG